MNRFSILIIINFCLLLFQFSCNYKSGKVKVLHENFELKDLKHAQNFKIEKSVNSTLLSICKKRKKNRFDTFQLVGNTSDIKNPATDIKVPCQKIVCLSSTQLTYFFALNDIDNIVAINSSRYLQHKGMNELLQSGKVKKIGKEGNFSIEMVAALNPDVIFVSPFKTGGYDVLRNLGIPMVPMAAYSEQTPLGRAEWIKMIALFLGKEKEADKIFNGIENRYSKLKALTSNVDYRPSVFSGKMRSGNWYVPGGESFYASYFKDAGADYIIKDTIQGAYPVGFETIYEKAATCDFWRIIHPEKIGFSMEDLLAQDVRYQDFEAFKSKHVLFCNIREKPYYEQAAMKPDTLLADYIYHFHPNLLPGYKPVFYEKLR